MANTIGANRKNAYRLWAESKGKRTLIDIANELGCSKSAISKWKNKDKWSLTKPPVFDDSKIQGGPPKGNKNAVGNKGGPPKGSKNALVTHEHETILLSTLTEDERQLVSRIRLDKTAVLHEELMLLTIRERRMMLRIDDLLTKSNNGMGIAKIVKAEGKSPDNRGRMRDSKNTQTEIMPVMNIIQRIEEALTKIQARKQIVVDQLHRIENDNRNYELNLKRLELEMMRVENANTVPAVEEVDDGFMSALEARVAEVWDNEPDGD